jgi:hypothetical protein
MMSRTKVYSIDIRPSDFGHMAETTEEVTAFLLDREGPIRKYVRKTIEDYIDEHICEWWEGNRQSMRDEKADRKRESRIA